MHFSRFKSIVILLLLLGVALLRGTDSFKKNIALVLVNQILNAPAIATTDFQQQLDRISWLLGPAAIDATPKSNIILAILQGIANLRRGDTAVAAAWFQTAASATSYQRYQRAIWVSPWMSIEIDGSLTVPGNSKLWRIRPDSLHAGTIEANQDGSGMFYCHKEDERRTAAFEWIQPYSLNYHHTIQIEARIERGSTLIVETNVNGQLQRPLTITGNGEWQISSASVTGTNGKLIYLILAQYSDETDQNKCEAQVNSIQFLVDDTVTYK